MGICEDSWPVECRHFFRGHLIAIFFPSRQDYYSRTALKGALDDIRPNKSFFGFHPHGCLVSKESVGMLGRGCQEATCREITSSWALGGAKKLPCRFPNTVPSCTIYLINLKGLRFYLLYLQTMVLANFFLCKSKSFLLLIVRLRFYFCFKFGDLEVIYVGTWTRDE